MLTGQSLPATPSRPVVVFLINSLTGGGAERVMAALLAASSKWAQRYELHLILLDREADAYPLPEWLQVHRLDSRFSLGRSLRLSVPLMRRLKPAVCLSFLTRANIVAVVSSRLCGFRAIISERVSPASHHGSGPRGVFARQTTRFFYPLAHRIICPSAGVAADLVEGYRVARSRIDVIPNPLNIDDIRSRATAVTSWKTQRPYIVAVGRLVENKNFALLLSALAKSRVPLDLVVLGEGRLRKALEENAFQLGLAGRIHFPGFVENPFPIIAQAEFFVSSSNAEGFPNAVVEAMALGVPVISTNCRSGPSEILDEREELSIDRLHEGQYGMLVPVGDVDALAQAIGNMTAGATRDRYRKAALLGADRFATAAALRRYWDVVEEQIGRPVRTADEADFA
ncbi:glycosyltransferase [Pararhizobium arenae]|uniref:glycosyltransferase n=1 Tax=Pararhizobium arenae TaxID=1856850 RepID=UPI00094AD8C0|nr:glycosyltransferase [Pararhizobium arenae]